MRLLADADGGFSKVLERLADPSKHAEGLDYVIVGGKIAAENAYATGELGGHVLLRE